MLRLPITLAMLAFLSPQASLAAAVPSKLSSVIVMSCVTTDSGAKVDEEIYKIDFVKRQVNNEPVEFEISDISLGWKWIFEKTEAPSWWDNYFSPPVVINRYSGKLERGSSGRLTLCRVAGARKF